MKRLLVEGVTGASLRGVFALFALGVTASLALFLTITLCWFNDDLHHGKISSDVLGVIRFAPVGALLLVATILFNWSALALGYRRLVNTTEIVFRAFLSSLFTGADFKTLISNLKPVPQSTDRSIAALVGCSPASNVELIEAVQAKIVIHANLGEDPNNVHCLMHVESNLRRLREEHLPPGLEEELQNLVSDAVLHSRRTIYRAAVEHTYKNILYRMLRLDEKGHERLALVWIDITPNSEDVKAFVERDAVSPFEIKRGFGGRPEISRKKMLEIATELESSESSVVWALPLFASRLGKIRWITVTPKKAAKYIGIRMSSNKPAARAGSVVVSSPIGIHLPARR
jgi:hypothetical protein